MGQCASIISVIIFYEGGRSFRTFELALFRGRLLEIVAYRHSTVSCHFTALLFIIKLVQHPNAFINVELLICSL